MIVRVARYRVKEGREEDFETLMRDQGIPQMKQQPGLMVAYVGRALEPERSHHYMTVTVWRSLDDVRQFGGSEWQQVVFLVPEARDMLEGPPELEQSESL